MCQSVTCEPCTLPVFVSVLADGLPGTSLQVCYSLLGFPGVMFKVWPFKKMLITPTQKGFVDGGVWQTDPSCAGEVADCDAVMKSITV